MRSIELVQRIGLNFFLKSHPVFYFSISVSEFLDEFSGRKSFRFRQVLIDILSSELNLFHFIVLLLRTK